MTNLDTLHHVTADNAATIWKWFQERGGIAVWQSINLSNLDQSWTTPLHDADGGLPDKPSWEADSHPSRIITDPAEVLVDVPQEVRRSHVAIRMGNQGLSLKLTDGSTRRVRAAVEKAGDGAWYSFDYSSQEAVVWRAGQSVPLTEFVAA